VAAAAPILLAETVTVLANRPGRFGGCAGAALPALPLWRWFPARWPARCHCDGGVWPHGAAHRSSARLPLQHSEEMARRESGGFGGSYGRGTGRGAGAGGTGNGANHGAGVWRVGSGAGRRVAGAWGVGMGVGHSAGAWGVGHRLWYRRLGRWRRRVTAECRALLRW
jgi:hypothetical protein